MPSALQVQKMIELICELNGGKIYAQVVCPKLLVVFPCFLDILISERQVADASCFVLPV